MSNLTLDGSTSFIGTEFIKLLATGSSPLATQEYVDDAIAEGGGGAVDAYTKTETDTLLDAKLNVNNPQTVQGTVRIADGNKLIINNNTIQPTEDFYCQGNSNFTGTVKVPILEASSNISTTQKVRSNVYDNYNADTKIKRNNIDFITLESDKILCSQKLKNLNESELNDIKTQIIGNRDADLDIKLQINTNDFIKLSATNQVIDVYKDIEMNSSTLKSDVLDTQSNTTLEIKRNGINYISLNSNDVALSKDLDMKTSTLKTNTFNVATVDTKISFMDNLFEYMAYENSTVDAEFNGLKINDNLYKLKMNYNNKIGFIAYVDPQTGWQGGDLYEAPKN